MRRASEESGDAIDREPPGYCFHGRRVWVTTVTVLDSKQEVYQQFHNRFPAVKEAFDTLGKAEHEAGPLGEKERRLVKLGIAVGAESEGAVRSHVRKLLNVGVSEKEILHTIVLPLATIGFPATNAAIIWAEEVLSEESRSF